jgi:hypothetical protein
MPTASPAAAWPLADPVMCRVLGGDEVYPVASASAYEDAARRPLIVGCQADAEAGLQHRVPRQSVGAFVSAGDTVQGGPVDELLDVAVERPVLE